MQSKMSLTDKLKKPAAISLFIAASATGCTALPGPGEGKLSHTVGFPRHPVMMAFQAGAYKIERGTTDEGTNTLSIRKDHWLGGDEGTVQIELPEGSTEIGYAVTQGLLDNNIWVGYNLGEDRFVEKYKVGMGARNIKLQETIPVIWDDKRDKYIRKEDN
jgi:hypothetical protein